MSKTKKVIKSGVIGYGGAFNMGLQHFNEMKKYGIDPAAVCELDPKRREAAVKDFPGIKTYAKVSDFLKDPDLDLVTVITPHNTHADLVIQCLEAKKHVVVEKPMAITTAECDKMIATAKKNKRMLSAYHNRHWDGCILQAVKTVRSGALGDLQKIIIRMGNHEKPKDWWRARKSVSGGILYDWGVHLLEYTLQLMNANIVEVTGFLHQGYWAPKVAWSKDCQEDEGSAIVRFDNGAWALLNMTCADANTNRPWLEITGNKGSYLMEWDKYTLITAKGKETVQTTGPNPEGEQYRYYKNVAEHITSNAPLIITGEWARRPIHIIDLACQSAAKGASMKAKYK